MVNIGENVEIDTPEFDKTKWKTSPNEYHRFYYASKKYVFIPCICGKQVKKIVMCKHVKTKKHLIFVNRDEIQRIKDESIELIEDFLIKS